MPVPAPLSAHTELDSAIASRLDHVVRLAREALGSSLRSVVLGGSLARGEALGVRDGAELRLLSDLDLYFVGDDLGLAPGLKAKLLAWAATDPFLVSPLDIAVVGPGFFREAPEAMPTHQLAHAHVVLWGEALDLPVAVGSDRVAMVDPEDAARLLFNRFVESLDPALGGLGSLREPMHRTKRFIDAPMAWLAAQGQYTPDRHEQLAQFRTEVQAWEGVAADRMETALGVWSRCLEVRDEGMVERDELERLTGDASLAADWTGGFALCLLERSGLDPLRDSMAGSLDQSALPFAVSRWLRREPWPARLRRARRWCSVAPPGVTPWWQHGTGGSGPDRIHGAATLCALGNDDWTAPLNGLSRQTPDEPAALHALWWRWIQGHGEED